MPGKPRPMPRPHAPAAAPLLPQVSDPHKFGRVADDGTVLAAGRYLGAAIDESTLPRGLGSRHIAAAGISSLTKAIAFVISESSGDVRIFKDGKVIVHIEKA